MEVTEESIHAVIRGVTGKDRSIQRELVERCFAEDVSIFTFFARSRGRRALYCGLRFSYKPTAVCGRGLRERCSAATDASVFTFFAAAYRFGTAVLDYEVDFVETVIDAKRERAVVWCNLQLRPGPALVPLRALRELAPRFTFPLVVWLRFKREKPGGLALICEHVDHHSLLVLPCALGGSPSAPFRLFYAAAALAQPLFVKLYDAALDLLELARPSARPEGRRRA
eukprot:tig00001110_g7077.t1